MRAHLYVALIAALPVLFGANSYAQKAGPEPAQAAQPSRDATDVLTVTGCVEREADYRSQIAEGKGTVAGTAGQADQFVLRSVRTVSTETLKPIAKDRPRFEDVYAMTGKLEHELGNAVGHQIAVSGYVEVRKTNGTSKVEDLPRMNVIGWHLVSDRCPATASKGGN
jgi:hypothetical protein